MPIELEISPRGEKVGEKITLNAGKTTFKEDGLDELFQAALKAGIKFTTEYQKTDMYIVSVPTPYDKFSKKVDPCYVVGDYPQLAKVIDESMKTNDYQPVFVLEPIHKVFGEDLTRPNFFFIEPLQYLEFVYLIEKSTVVLTDSGGIQEEAPGLGKPVLVMRDTTERPEALESGTVHLVGTNHDLIVSEVSTLLEDAAAYERMSKAVNPYGDGKACERIVRVLKGEEVDRYEV